MGDEFIEGHGCPVIDKARAARVYDGPEMSSRRVSGP
jgi:hypothetical protein